MNRSKLTSRNLSQERTREALLAAAAKLVAEKGFGGVSIGDVVTAAGFTKGAFYSNFDSREAMLIELMRRVHLQQRTVVSELQTQSVLSLEAALERMIEIALRHATSPTASLLIGEVQMQGRRSPEFSAGVRKGFEEQLRQFSGWIDTVLKTAGVKPALSSAEIAHAAMALSQGLSQQTIDLPTLKKIVRQVFPLLFRPAG